MQGMFGSMRRSLVFNPSMPSFDDGGGGGSISGFVEKIGTSIRKSRIGLFAKPGKHALPPPGRREADETPSLRWRKGELIGSGAFGCVYMGMNLDSGELLAVKQVLIAPSSASKEKMQAHIRDLEEEVKLLKNLSHSNIVRYLGTTREEDSLSILMEFVPGGSISSLLGKFGSFPESVIKRYTQQLLQGLEYLHKNKILHRDIKGANILVDNKGYIKLADFGASKKVVELATINGAKSLKGTPCWMAPEVIVQSGYSFSADIWSVGCTIIEMATGKPPWSEQYQEVAAALFYVGTTKSHPPIPEHLSAEAKDFLLKCLQKEPHLRPDASELLEHPFVTNVFPEAHTSVVKDYTQTLWELSSRNSINSTVRGSTYADLKELCAAGSDDEMCQIDDTDDFLPKSSTDKILVSEDSKDLRFKRGGESIEENRINSPPSTNNAGGNDKLSANTETQLPCETFPLEDDEELTESKIRTFLDEKALELKKLQSPLYEDFYNTLNGLSTVANNDNQSSRLKFPPPAHSPKRLASRRLSSQTDNYNGSPASDSNRAKDRVLHEIPPPQSNDLSDKQNTSTPSAGLSEQKKIIWEEELHQELERRRELMRQAGAGGRTSSPNERNLQKRRETLKFASPTK